MKIYGTFHFGSGNFIWWYASVLWGEREKKTVCCKLSLPAALMITGKKEHLHFGKLDHYNIFTTVTPICNFGFSWPIFNATPLFERNRKGTFLNGCLWNICTLYKKTERILTFYFDGWVVIQMTQFNIDSFHWGIVVDDRFKSLKFRANKIQTSKVLEYYHPLLSY